MNPLPYISVQWDESTEDYDTFARYLVYKREAGSSAWTVVARIANKTVTFFEDPNVRSGVTYEYAVTVVAVEADGTEIESDFPTPVSASLITRSTFIHDVSDPAYYAEIPMQTSLLERLQDLAFVQVRARYAPTAHHGVVNHRRFSFQFTRRWEDDSDVWDAIMTLFARQRTGSTLCLRTYRGELIYCQFAISRADEGLTFSPSIEVTEVYHSEAA